MHERKRLRHSFMLGDPLLRDNLPNDLNISNEKYFQQQHIVKQIPRLNFLNYISGNSESLTATLAKKKVYYNTYWLSPVSSSVLNLLKPAAFALEVLLTICTFVYAVQNIYCTVFRFTSKQPEQIWGNCTKANLLLALLPLLPISVSPLQGHVSPHRLQIPGLWQEEFLLSRGVGPGGICRIS